MSTTHNPSAASSVPASELKEGEHRVGDDVVAKQRPAASTASWIITLFGTAVGAGILFLPLNAGGFGFWPLVFATVFILPLVYFSHRTYARIVAGAPQEDHGKDILELVTQYLGKGSGVVFALLYLSLIHI